jgi:AraC-like DNA-binding protein
MKYTPSCPILQKHIDYYLIEKEANSLFKSIPYIYAYPGIRPELLLVLDGSLSFTYENKNYHTSKSKLFSFINEKVILDISKLNAVIVIYFKPKAIASIRPFTNTSTENLMRNNICDGEDVFGNKINHFITHLKSQNEQEIAFELDNWFTSFYNADREGFLVEMINEIQHEYSPKRIMQLTNYSYSTLERQFKNDAGLSPKQFQSLKRCKLAVEEIYESRNNNWMHYVEKYGYFDQSHFIKEIKRFTSLTPSQLLITPGLLSLRSPNF